MGSSESTGRSNGTKEEERQQENDSSDGAMGAGTAIAIAAAGTVVAAWGISRMISGSTDTESQEKDEVMRIEAHGMESVLLNSHTNGNQKGVRKHHSTLSPPPRRFKMKTDGACRSKQGPSGNEGIHPNDRVMRGPSGYGGILLDEHGKWVQGFRGFIGVSDCLTTELHGILKGLELLDKLGLKESILENDCQAAVDWVTGKDNDPGKSPIICDCWKIIKKSRLLVLKNKITISRCSREDNKFADKLANMAIDKQERYVDIINLRDEIKAVC